VVDALADGGEVGEGAAEPALVDVGHFAAGGLLGDGLLGLLLGADEEDLPPVGDEVADGVHGPFHVTEALLKIDDVDAVSLGEDVLFHAGVPAAGLMPEMDACFQQRLHGDGRALLLMNRRILYLLDHES